MRRLWAAFALLAGATAPAEAAPCGLELAGQVLDADLGTPLSGAVVTAASGEQSVQTGPDGRFLLEGLCRGAVEVRASKAGFRTAVLEVQMPSAPVRIRLRFPTQPINIRAPSAPDPFAQLGFESTLEGEDLARARGLNLAETLQATPGVTIIRSGAVSKPVIDGFFGNRILILNDGLRHHSQLWSLDHAPEIDPFSADRITVIRGAEGVRYGADAIGGVISIDPPAYLEPEDAGFQGEGNLVGFWNGRGGLANLSVVGTVPYVPQLSYRLQASGRKTGTFDTPNYPLSNTGVEEVGVSGGVRYLGDGWLAAFSASRLSNQYAVFSGIRADGRLEFEAVIEAGEPQNVEDYEFSYDIFRAYSEVTHTFLRSEVQLDVGQGRLKLLYGYQLNDRREFDFPRTPTPLPQLRFELESHALELSFDHPVGDKASIAVGASGLVQNNLYFGNRFIPTYDRWMAAAYGLARWTLDPRLEVSGGVRYERQGMDTSMPTARNPNGNPPDTASLDFDALMATAGLAWTPASGWGVDMRLAHAARIPSVDELFLVGPVPGEIFYVEGDRELEPERTTNLGLGVRYESARITAEAVGFIHYLQDYIYRGPRFDRNGDPDLFEDTIRGSFPALEYRNVDVIQGGGTLSLKVRPWYWLELAAQANYVRARNLTDDAFLFNLPVDRYHGQSTFLIGTAGPFQDIEVYAALSYVAELAEPQLDIELQPPPPDYALLSFGGSTFIGNDSLGLRMSLDVQNFFDITYRDYLSRLRYFADEPGFQAILRLGLPFQVGLAPKQNQQGE